MFRLRVFLLPGGGGGDQAFDVELVRVQQQAHERHLVVGLIADVGEHEEAGAGGEIVDAGRRIEDGRCLYRRAQDSEH